MKQARLTLAVLYISATLYAQSHSSAQFFSTGDLSSNRTAPADPTTRNRVIETYVQLPLVFEANQGQFDSQVKFQSRGAGYSLFLTPAEAVIALRDVSQKSTFPVASPRSAEEKSTVLRLRLVGASARTQVFGQDQLQGKSNYFGGNDPEKWHTDIPQYSRVRYAGVYPGVD